uniref:2'-5' oligoadenylate synthase n=1 Tax=Sus scrofa TaxID=9823 RepID=A0A4X1THB8_PIG
MELRHTPARDLDKFIEDHLLPNTCFRTQVKEAIDIVCRFLKERCFQGTADPVRVSKVVKGGSSGKGTTLRGRSDADLVVFLTKLTSFEDQLRRRGEFIQEIRRQLEACQREQKFKVTFEVQSPRRENPRALSFVLSSPQLQQEVEFDVLPAFDALGQWTPGYKPNPEIYVQLIQECKSRGKEGEFSTCFTELQRDFLRNRPTKLKSLIRLVKHWYQTVWWVPSRQRGFQTVLELVLKHQKLCIFWEAYYDFTNPVVGRCMLQQLKKPRPVILDPADPTGNVGGGDTYSWQQLVEGALIWLDYPCFLKWNRSPVGSWNVSPEAKAPPQEEDI